MAVKGAVPVASQYEEEMRKRAERARRLGLFRYEVIQEAVDPALSAKQRGALVRELAARTHAGPEGELVKVARGTFATSGSCPRTPPTSRSRPPTQHYSAESSPYCAASDTLARAGPTSAGAGMLRLADRCEPGGGVGETVQVDRHQVRVGRVVQRGRVDADDGLVESSAAMWLPQVAQKPRLVWLGWVSYHLGSPSPVHVRPCWGNPTHHWNGPPALF